MSILYRADRLADVRRFRVLTLVDNFSRVSPALEADFSLSGEKGVAALERLARAGRKPKILQVDNGPEFISKVLDAWAHTNEVHLELGRPAKPTNNLFIASFNGKLRTECLDQNWFASLTEAKEYTTERPHTALNYQMPEQYLKNWRTKQQWT